MGDLALSYAVSIFGAGQELLSVLRQENPDIPSKVVIGITQAMPKLVVKELMQPALDLEPRAHVVCEEDSIERLLVELAVHKIDVVLSDCPVPPSVEVKAFNHLLGECSITMVASKSLAKRYRPGFPESLTGAPMLVPTIGSAVRRSLDTWMVDRRIEPELIAEVADSALTKVLGSDGLGIFAVPSVIATAVCKTYGVEVVGQVPEVTERFYAISTERRIRHPGVLAITESARSQVF